jgi:hypothetical protein
MVILGALLFVVGLFFCFTIIGIPLGLVLMLLGSVFMALGGRRRVVVRNVVQVTNTNVSGQPRPDYDQEPVTRAARSSTADVRREPALPKPAPRQLPEPPPFELELDEDEFTDVRADVTAESKRVLAFAKADGFEIAARPDRIIVRKDGSEWEFRRNSDILAFGDANGFG